MNDKPRTNNRQLITSPTMSTPIRALTPTAPWNHFADLNAVPRPSKREERVAQFVADFGKKIV